MPNPTREGHSQDTEFGHCDIHKQGRRKPLPLSQDQGGRISAEAGEMQSRVSKKPRPKTWNQTQQGRGGQEGKEGLWGWFWSQQPRLWFPWSSSGCMQARHLRQHMASSACVDPLPLPAPRGAGPPSYHTGLQCLSAVAATRAPPHPVLRNASS